MKSLLCSLVCCVFIWCNTFAQTDYSFYISPSLGNNATGVVNDPNQPFEHIQHVLNLISADNTTYNSNTSVEVLLMGGEYYEQLYIFNTHISQLTIKPATTNEKVTIYGTFQNFPKDIWYLDANYPVPAAGECAGAYTIDERVYYTNITINTAPPAPIGLKKENWLFRADGTQLYGYKYLDYVEANLDFSDPPYTNDYEEVFFSTRLAEAHEGVGYTIQDHPTDPNKLRIYVAVNPDDDFIASEEQLQFTKNGPIIALGQCSNVNIDGGPNKLITLKYSETGVLGVDGINNILIKNLRIQDTKYGVWLRTNGSSNIDVENNEIIHNYTLPVDLTSEPCNPSDYNDNTDGINNGPNDMENCNEDSAFPATDSKNQMVQSIGVLVNSDQNTSTNIKVKDNYIAGTAKGVSVVSAGVVISGNVIEEIVFDGIELEGAAGNIECFGNLIKNAYNALSLVTVSAGPIYFHENVIYNTRVYKKFGNAKLCNSAVLCCQRYRPFKFTNNPLDGGTEVFYDSPGWSITRDVYFYYNTIYAKGAALTLGMVNGQPEFGATESFFYNNIFYSSDGPCTDGAGEYCNGIVLKGNAVYTDRDITDYDYFDQIPISGEFLGWGYLGNNGNNPETLSVNMVTGADCDQYPLATNDYYNQISQIVWAENYKRKWTFPNVTISSNQISDFNPLQEHPNWFLENIDNYPPLMDPNRTIPGAIEVDAENDECDAALNIQANPNNSCTLSYEANTYNATPSTGFSSPSCVGNITIDDDVWFKFTAVSTTHEVILSNFSENLFYIVYASCSGTILSCNGYSNPESGIGPLYNLTVGNEYFIRVFTRAESVGTSFTICVNSPLGLAPGGGGAKARGAKTELTVGELHVFPNPNNGQFVWQFTGDDSPLVWMLFDPQGRKLQQANVQPADGHYTHHMNLRQLPKGLYLLSVQQGDDHYFEKIIVE